MGPLSAVAVEFVYLLVVLVGCLWDISGVCCFCGFGDLSHFILGHLEPQTENTFPSKSSPSTLRERNSHKVMTHSEEEGHTIVKLSSLSEEARPKPSVTHVQVDCNSSFTTCASFRFLVLFVFNHEAKDTYFKRNLFTRNIQTAMAPCRRLKK